MSKLILPIGVPGCGKSTQRKKIEETIGKENFVAISPDDIRAEILNDTTDQSNNTNVFLLAEERAIEALNNGKTVYFDATNAQKIWRDKLLKKLKENSISNVETIAYFFETDLETSLKRNSNRDRVVPEEVLENMFAQMISEENILGNEFDNVSIVSEDGSIKEYNSIEDFQKWFLNEYQEKNQDWKNFLSEEKIESNKEILDLKNILSELKKKEQTEELQEEIKTLEEKLADKILDSEEKFTERPWKKLDSEIEEIKEEVKIQTDFGKFK